jgi:hypothetical protein
MGGEPREVRERQRPHRRVTAVADRSHYSDEYGSMFNCVECLQCLHHVLPVQAVGQQVS